jgi:hypothetical protein
MGYWAKRAMSVAELKLVAAESIRFQDKKKLAALAELVETFRRAGDFSPAGYDKSGIEKWVFDTVGVTVMLRNGSEIGLAQFAFAGVEPPKLDANNPIVSNLHRQFYRGNNDLDAYTKFIKENELAGTFDDSNAKIGGDLSKVASPLYVTPVLMGPDLKMTDYEIAAIILHEVGHVYYYFRCLMRGIVVNLIADAAANRMMSMESPAEKLRVVKDVERMLNTKIDQPETICNEYKKENLYVHLVTATLLERPNITGGEGFGNRTWERAADDFAARFGAAPHLAAGLYKLETSPMYLLRSSSYMNMGVHLTLELGRVALLVLWSTQPIGLLMAALSVTFGMLANDPSATIYDPPQERFETMRRVLVEELKTLEGISTKDANAHRSRILEGISQVDALLKTVKDKDNLYGFIYKNLVPSGRRERDAVDYQRDLESYMSNDLTVAMNKLKASAA